ncbi:MAG: DUF3299 domain-containing protein [Magnetospiraceae bacterium]
MRYVLSAVFVFFLVSTSVQADAVRTLAWEDLQPPLPPLVDPFDTLTEAQQDSFISLTGIEELKRQGINVAELGFEKDQDELNIRAKLRAQGIDPDELLRKDFEFRQEVERRNGLLNEALNGERVKIPGYALPLEFSGEAVTEFLLVPYVGACIHVPPPPMNQTVFVRVQKPFQPTNLYDPVWVTGLVRVEQSQKNLSLVDGQSAVDVGYILEEGTVEPYVE